MFASLRRLAFAVSALTCVLAAQVETGKAPPDRARKAVLVTGASSGLGRATAERLAAGGFFVYAGARKQKDLDALDAIDHVQAVKLDVTVQADIDAAVQTVTDAGRGLFALINNAGVLVMAPMIELREQDLAFQLDVNLYGPFRLTKAFAPLLIESKGRVLTTGSLSGTVCWAFGGPYCISKHAVEALTDCLAAELQPFDVQVGVVQPGNYRSDIMSTMHERMQARGYTAQGSRYARNMAGLMRQPDDRARYPAPDDVAEAYTRALSADTMQRRYLVVPIRREAERTLAAAVERIAQMNANHEHSLSREELVKMLDAAMKRAAAPAAVPAGKKR
ncbi:MAG: SDR family oxidoreductase [Planctomycetota bacterium]